MENLLRSRVLKFSLFGLLTAALIIGSLFSGIITSAQTPAPTSVPVPSLTGNQTVFGRVTDISADSISIQFSGETPVTVNVGVNTTYVVLSIHQEAISTVMGWTESLLKNGVFPSYTEILSILGSTGTSYQIASLADVKVGDYVIATNGAGNQASQIMVIRLANIKILRGTVTDMSGNSITITPPGGNAVTVSWNDSTRILLKGLVAVQINNIADVLYNDTDNTLVFALITFPSTPTPTVSVSPAVTVIPSPGASTAANQISVDASFSGKSVTMSVGNTLIVTLQSNASTGFSWQLVQISDPAILEKVSNQYQPPATSIPGAPGNEVWTFKALKSGTSAILMEYSQPFSGGIKGAQTFSLTVNVK